MRPTFRGISAPVQITPVASPVNSYVRPADPAPSNLHQLAEGLAAFDQGLSSFMEKRKTVSEDADKVRAEAAFNTSRQAEWGEAVRQGLVPANASPIFQKTYKGMEGNYAGIKLREKFQSDYMKWEGRNSNDPAKFNEFLTGLVKDNVTTQDVDVLRGLNPHIAKLFEDGHQTFQKDSADSVYKGALNTAGAIVGKSIDEANKQALGNKKAVNYDGLMDDIEALREVNYKSGVRGEHFDSLFVDAIVAKATEYGDPMLLEKLKGRKVPGMEVNYGDVPEFRDRIAQGFKSLETTYRQQKVDLDKAQKEADQVEEDEITRSTIEQLFKDPTAEIPEEQIVKLEKHNPKARMLIAEVRKASMDKMSTDDPRRVKMLLVDISEGKVVEKDLLDMVRKQQITDPSTVTSLLDRIKRVREDKAKGSGLLENPSAKRYKQMIIERTRDKDADISKFLGDDGMTDEGLEALNEYEAKMLRWDDQHPDADDIERDRAIKEIGDGILGRINPDVSGKDPRKFVSDTQQAQDEADALFKQQKEGGVQQERKDAAGIEQKALADDMNSGLLDNDPVETERLIQEQRDQRQQQLQDQKDGRETQSLYEGEEPPAIDTLPEDNRTALEEGAKRAGMTPEELNMEIWKRTRQVIGKAMMGEDYKAPDVSTQTEDIPKSVGELNEIIKQAPASIDLKTTGSIGKMIDNALANQTVEDMTKTSGEAAPLLNLFGTSEGTDKGRGYNETLGYGAYTGGDVELTKMTLGELDKLQTQMLRHPDNKWNSSAAGRYQIVRTTMRKLKKQLGLTDDMVFDEKMQDKLALTLLKGRGYDKWRSGEMTDAAFMKNLAKEWASIPQINGKGYYTGQRAGVAPEDVLSAFQATKTSTGEASAFDAVLNDPPAAYKKIPAKEVQQFREWNSDPVANHETVLKSVDTRMQEVVATAKEALAAEGITVVAASGHRDEEMQKKALKWGWTKTMKSNHLGEPGGVKALDLWIIGEDGAIDWDQKKQEKVSTYMKEAAKALGVNIGWGGDWKSFKDRPHFEIKD